MIEPVKVEAYICPVCKEVLTCSYDEALKHVNQPVLPPLPRGLVYIQTSGGYQMVDRPESVLNSDHSPIHRTLNFMLKSKEGFYRYEIIETSFFIERIQEGKFKLLTLEEFDEFVNLNKKTLSSYAISGCVPVRTTPDLEKLLGGSK